VFRFGLGKGLIEGLAVTWENFVNTYLGRGHRIVTIQYPEERIVHPERFRIFPFLVYDGDDPGKSIRCTACGMCERECPPSCIRVDRDRDENGKPVSRPRLFEIDCTVCMSCGICVEVCPFDAIKMDHDFERSEYTREAAVYHLEELLKPISYFHAICPAMAREEEEERRKKEEKKRKAAEAKTAARAAAGPSQSE